MNRSEILKTFLTTFTKHKTMDMYRSIIQFILVCLLPKSAIGFADFWVKDNFVYLPEDIIETIGTGSSLQCARWCSSTSSCVSFEFDAGNADCVILNNVTRIEETIPREQFSIYGACGEGWKRFAQSCYMLTIDKYFWDVCNDVCAGIGGHQVTITSQMENDFVSSHKSGWIGAENEIDETGNVIWKWVTGEPWDYTNWEPNQPDEDNVPGICARFFGGIVQWRDRACDFDMKCICEKSAL